MQKTAKGERESKGNHSEDVLFYKNLGNRIRQGRLSAEMTQEGLAEYLGLTRVSIVNIEKGRQRLPIFVLCKIAEALRLEVTSLLPDVSSRQTKVSGEIRKIISSQVIADKHTKAKLLEFIGAIDEDKRKNDE